MNKLLVLLLILCMGCSMTVLEIEPPANSNYASAKLTNIAFLTKGSLQDANYIEGPNSVGVNIGRRNVSTDVQGLVTVVDGVARFVPIIP